MEMYQVSNLMKSKENIETPHVINEKGIYITELKKIALNIRSEVN